MSRRTKAELEAERVQQDGHVRLRDKQLARSRHQGRRDRLGSVYRRPLAELKVENAELKAENKWFRGELDILRENYRDLYELLKWEDYKREVTEQAREAAAKHHADFFNKYVSHIVRGQKTLNSSKEGHQAVYGTPQEKEAKWRQYQTFIDEKHEENPEWSYRKCAEKAANRFEVCLKTITRHTKDWEKN